MPTNTYTAAAYDAWRTAERTPHYHTTNTPRGYCPECGDETCCCEDIAQEGTENDHDITEEGSASCAA